MSLNGKLQDFELAEVLQFLSRGKNTGLLTLTTEQESGHGPAILTTAKVHLEQGKVVFATAGFRNRLGNLLMDQGIVDRENLRTLLDKQRLSPSRRRFGALLIEERILCPEGLKQQVHAQILQVLGAVLSWRAGTFSFEKQNVVAGDDLDAAQGLSVDRLLLEIHRRQDEAVLDGARDCLEKSAPTAAEAEAVEAVS